MAIIEDLIVADYGAFVGLQGGRLRVEAKECKRVEAPLLHLRSVQIHTRSASISAAALAACCEAGIPVHFVDGYGGSYASVISSNLTTVVATRRAQMEALLTPVGVDIARALAVGKITSQAVNLRYLARRLEGDLAHTFKDVEIELLGYADQIQRLQAEDVNAVRAHLMGVEGYSAKRYWATLALLIPADYGWLGRTGRHATDDVNILLNYGYGILYGEVQNALVLAGLEPYAGLIHTDRPGKPSLTCDLIEEFRAPIVDRTVIGLVARQYEIRRTEDGRLEREFRKNFAEHILSRLNAQGSLNGKRYQLRSIIQHQARRLAAAFRNAALYQAYIGG
jgi:CRISP-associated protein Cas1